MCVIKYRWMWSMWGVCVCICVCLCVCVCVCVCVMTNPLNIHSLSPFEIGSLRKKVPITQVTFNPFKSCQHQDIHQSPGCSYFPPKLLASLVHG